MEIIPSPSGIHPYALRPLNAALDTPPPPADTRVISTLPGGDLPDWSEHCLTCRGKKYFTTRLGDGSLATCECNCREQWILMRRMQAANIDQDYARMSWARATGVPTGAEERVREYLANLDANIDAGLGLILFSDRRGTGKTLLTTLILKEIMAQGHTVFFARFLHLINLFSRTWKDDTTEAWFVRCIERATALGIDDIGKEGAQEGRFGGMIDRLLDSMLRSRVANNRLMIVNSNLDPDSERVGDSFGQYQQDVLELLSEVNEPFEVRRPSFRTERRRQKQLDARDGVVYPVVVR